MLPPALTQCVAAPSPPPPATGDLVRRFPNPTNTTSGGNIQPAANGTNNNMILITSERVLKNGTKETFTAYEQGACTPFKFDLKSYLAGTKSRFKDMEASHDGGPLGAEGWGAPELGEKIQKAWGNNKRSSWSGTTCRALTLRGPCFPGVNSTDQSSCAVAYGISFNVHAACTCAALPAFRKNSQCC